MEFNFSKVYFLIFFNLFLISPIFSMEADKTIEIPAEVTYLDATLTLDFIGENVIAYYAELIIGTAILNIIVNITLKKDCLTNLILRTKKKDTLYRQFPEKYSDDCIEEWLKVAIKTALKWVKEDHIGDTL